MGYASTARQFCLATFAAIIGPAIYELASLQGCNFRQRQETCHRRGCGVREVQATGCCG